MSLRISLWVSVVMVLLSLGGCDGDVGFHDAAGALERASGRKLVRGLADQGQQVNEDEETTRNRRDMVEALAKRQGLILSDDLGEILRGNKRYHDIVFTSPMAEVPGLPAYPVQVEFDIEGGYHAQMQFLVQQATMLGFVHLTKLPIFDSGSVKHGGDVLHIPPVDLFGLTLAGDHNALKARSDQVWGGIQARQAAAASSIAASAAQALADAKQADCEKQVHSQDGDFEVDPSLSDADKQAAVAKFQDEQSVQLKQCVAR